MITAGIFVQTNVPYNHSSINLLKWPPTEKYEIISPEWPFKSELCRLMSSHNLICLLRFLFWSFYSIFGFCCFILLFEIVIQYTIENIFYIPSPKVVLYYTPSPNRHLSTTALYLRPQGCQKCREVWLCFLKPVCNVNCTSPTCFITELHFVENYALVPPAPFLHHHHPPLKKTEDPDLLSMLVFTSDSLFQTFR